MPDDYRVFADLIDGMDEGMPLCVRADEDRIQADVVLRVDSLHEPDVGRVVRIQHLTDDDSGECYDERLSQRPRLGPMLARVVAGCVLQKRHDETVATAARIMSDVDFTRRQPCLERFSV